MTSMPASRRARAMIFAPRSWPSRPGLAIKTRIFFSGILLCDPILIYWPRRWPNFGLLCEALRCFAAAPIIACESCLSFIRHDEDNAKTPRTPSIAVADAARLDDHSGEQS